MKSSRENSISKKFWTRRRINFGFGIQSFATSSFGGPGSHGRRFGFGEYEYGRLRFGSPGPHRGPTTSSNEIDFYQGYRGRLSSLCIRARGELAAEEIYWRKYTDRRIGCRPFSNKIPGHYVTLRRAKINGITAYLYYQWRTMPPAEKEWYKGMARGKRLSGINCFLKVFFRTWGFGRASFGLKAFGSHHQPPVFFGFATVAFGQGAFGTPYPRPRRLGFGVQPFGEIRFGSNLLKKRILREFS